MQVSVKLYGPLRDHLPKEMKGQTKVSFVDGATVADLLSEMGITGPVLVAINEAHESAESEPLKDGDRVLIFEPSAGG